MRSLVSGALAALVLAPAMARAEPKRADEKHASDSTYGRIEGDLTIVSGAGITVAPRAPRGTVDFRLRYLDMAGIFTSYEDALGMDSDPRRVIAGGIEVRPLFIARWGTGCELSRGRLDLMLDSIGLELGAWWGQPAGGSFGGRPGLQASLGFEIPILAQASGPWIGLHGGGRWSDGALSGDPLAGPSDRAAFLSITLAWHQMVMTHVVDVGDRAPR